VFSRETTHTNVVVFSLNHARSTILEGASKSPMIMTINTTINDRQSLCAWYTNKKYKLLFVSNKYSKKIYIMKIVFKISLSGKKYVNYKYGSLKSYQRGISYLLTEALDKIL